MKYLNFTKYIALLAMFAFVFSSCDKVATPEPMGDAGQTLVKVLGGGTPATIKKNPVDFDNNPKRILVLDLRRDIPNPTELNRTMIVVVKDDTAAVRAANPNYINLPSAWYTLESEAPRVGGVGGTYTFTFGPGDFAKQIYLNLPDATLMNPSALYAIAFTIISADADGVISTQKSVVVEIGAKNAYDGIYEITGTFVDVTNPAFTDAYPLEWDLVTVGGNTVDVWDNVQLGFPGYLFSNAGAGTYYGALGLVVSFNPANGAISDLHNYYGDPTKAATPGGNPALGTGPPNYAASNTRRAVIDPSGINAFNSATHDIDVKWWLLHPSVMGNNNPRSFFDEHWNYLGPR